MTRATLSFFIMLLTGFITGCATSLDGERYAAQEPEFNLFQFFDGDVKAWGIVQNLSGEVVQRFEVSIQGRIDGTTLTLDETFSYKLGDGVMARTWTIVDNGDGTFSGGASDILSQAVGASYGNAFRWSYAMDLPVDNGSYRVQFEDWIFALDEDRILNRSYIQKLGVDVAEVTLFMERT